MEKVDEFSAVDLWTMGANKSLYLQAIRSLSRVMSALHDYRVFEQLFEAQYSQLYRFALSRVNQKEIAEDIVADAFEYLWRNRLFESVHPTPEAVLFSIVRSRCIDYFRHEEVKNTYENYTKETNRLSEEMNLWDTHQERIGRIQAAIELLPPQAKEAFKQCFLHGRTYKEAARAMNLSPNTVKTHISKALAFVRETVNKQESEADARASLSISQRL